MAIGRIAKGRDRSPIFRGLQGGLQSLYSNPIIRFQHAYPRRLRELVTAGFEIIKADAVGRPPK